MLSQVRHAGTLRGALQVHRILSPTLNCSVRVIQLQKHLLYSSPTSIQKAFHSITNSRLANYKSKWKNTGHQNELGSSRSRNFTHRVEGQGESSSKEQVSGRELGVVLVVLPMMFLGFPAVLCDSYNAGMWIYDRTIWMLKWKGNYEHISAWRKSKVEKWKGRFETALTRRKNQFEKRRGSLRRPQSGGKVRLTRT